MEGPVDVLGLGLGIHRTSRRPAAPRRRRRHRGIAACGMRRRGGRRALGRPGWVACQLPSCLAAWLPGCLAAVAAQAVVAVVSLERRRTLRQPVLRMLDGRRPATLNNSHAARPSETAPTVARW